MCSNDAVNVQSWDPMTGVWCPLEGYCGSNITPLGGRGSCWGSYIMYYIARSVCFVTIIIMCISSQGDWKQILEKFGDRTSDSHKTPKVLASAGPFQLILVFLWYIDVIYHTASVTSFWEDGLSYHCKQNLFRSSYQHRETWRSVNWSFKQENLIYCVTGQIEPVKHFKLSQLFCAWH